MQLSSLTLYRWSHPERRPLPLLRVSILFRPHHQYRKNGKAILCSAKLLAALPLGSVWRKFATTFLYSWWSRRVPPPGPRTPMPQQRLALYLVTQRFKYSAVLLYLQPTKQHPWRVSLPFSQFTGFVRFHWKRLSLYSLLGIIVGSLLVVLYWQPYHDQALILIHSKSVDAHSIAKLSPITRTLRYEAEGRLLKITGKGLSKQLATLDAQQGLTAVENVLEKFTPETLPATSTIQNDLSAYRTSLVRLTVKLARLRAMAAKGQEGMVEAARLLADHQSVANALEAFDAAPEAPKPETLATLNRVVRLVVEGLEAEQAGLTDVVNTLSRSAPFAENPVTFAPEKPFSLIEKPGKAFGPVLLMPFITMGATFLAGLLAGAWAAMVDDFKRGQVRNLGRLRAQFNLPVVGALPQASDYGSRTLSALNLPENTVLSETVRSLFAALRLKSLRGEPARVVLMASPMAGDGKSALTAWLAQTAQNAGLRVCVVDADLRRPTQHRLFGVGNAKGLADYLSGVTGVDRIIYDRHETRVHVVTTRATPHMAIGLVSSARMSLLLSELRERYDLVLVDTPSCMGLSDAALIAPLCDCVLMLARAEKTTFAHLGAALLPFQGNKNTPVMLVVTHMRQHNLTENASLQGAASYLQQA